MFKSSIAATVVAAMVMGFGAVVGTSSAQAAEVQPASSVGCSTTVGTTGTSIDDAKLQQLLNALDKAATTRTPQEFARVLFPDDLAAQAEVAALVEVATTSEEGSDFRALPALLIPFVAVLGRCAVGALGGAAVGEIVHLVRTGEQASAESRVEAVIGGCITSVIPPALRALANKLKKPMVAAVLAIIIRWNS
ncbi:hypothetical protein [Austwickia chelonae]|uniref:hypothetical protein n=1 Tax=Austwickia chelonae TaxID=100225 RepID=UPI0013C2F648|nr:hypothetical protein [Austwickia chelonae]